MRMVSIMLLLSTFSLAAMNQTPMDSAWFYSDTNPYKSANDLYQERKWEEAETEYTRLLAASAGDERDQAMAKVNCASCQMAQRKRLDNWVAYDDVCGTPADKKLATHEPSDSDTVLVKTDKIGIGDIAHFLPAIKLLKEKVGAAGVVLAARGFLHNALEGPAKEMGVTVVNEKDEAAVAQANEVTHLMALLGHLKMQPEQLRLERPLFTHDEQTVGRVKIALAPHLQRGKRLGVLFLGENRAATLMGGKQLPRMQGRHGRHLDARAFAQLLRDHPELVLVDCNSPKSPIHFDDDADEADHLALSCEFENRVVRVPDEQKPFDSLIALGRVVRTDHPDYVGFGADNGPTNMFSRSLDGRAQRRFTFVIPNPQEYDMRMEGPGDSYSQMISDCRVVKCAGPSADQQAQAVRRAYEELTGDA